MLINIADRTDARQNGGFARTQIEEDAAQFAYGAPRRQENRPARQFAKSGLLPIPGGKALVQYGTRQGRQKGRARGNGEDIGARLHTSHHDA